LGDLAGSAAYAGGVVFSKLLRAGEGKILRRLSKIADAVESLSDEVGALTDAELRAKTDEFKERYADGESLDQLLPEAFAVVREAATRTLGQRHYRVQLMGGAALHLGQVAEMKIEVGGKIVLNQDRQGERHISAAPNGQQRLFDVIFTDDQAVDLKQLFGFPLFQLCFGEDRDRDRYGSDPGFILIPLAVN
jgi:hypothetical protein